MNIWGEMRGELPIKEGRGTHLGRVPIWSELPIKVDSRSVDNAVLMH